MPALAVLAPTLRLRKSHCFLFGTRQMLLIAFGFTVLLTAAPADADNSAGLAAAGGGPETDAVLLAI